MKPELLEQYKEYLDYGSNQGMGRKDPDLSRYHSVKQCLEYLYGLNKPVVLELGTCRSFVDGGIEGCNLDDPRYWRPDEPQYWDWGAGCFMLVVGQLLKGADLTTVDSQQSHINRSAKMMESLNIECERVISDSVKYLSITQKTFDLIYLDTGDMWPIEQSADLQRKESEVIVNRDLVRAGGLLLIDDVLNKTPRELGDIDNYLGKSKYSLPYLLQNRYEIIYKGYQYLLRKMP